MQPSMPMSPSRPGFLTRHPIAVSSLLAATGAIAALPIATIISGLALVFLGDSLLASRLPPDYAEGLGYLFGFYCLIMFPVGAALLGLVSGAVAHSIRPIHDDPPTPLVSLTVGIVISTLVTLALSIAALILFME